MIILNSEQFKQHLAKKYAKKDVFEDNKYLYYFVKDILLTALLICSAYFSFNAHLKFMSGYTIGIIEPEYLAIMSTLLASFLIGILGNKILQQYVAGVINKYLVISLIGMLGFNVYLDMVGVEEIAKGNIVAPESVDTDKIVDNYNKQVADLEARERSILAKYVAPSNRGKDINFLRSAYIPKQGNKWHSKEQVENDLQQLELIGIAYIDAQRAHNKTLDIEQFNYEKKRVDYVDTLQASILSKRWGAVIVSLLIISSLVFVGYIESKTFTTAKPERNLEETIQKPQETVKGNKIEVNISESLVDDVAQLKLSGATNTQIVDRLGISKGTVTKCLQSYAIKHIEQHGIKGDEEKITELCKMLGIKRNFKGLNYI